MSRLHFSVKSSSSEELYDLVAYKTKDGIRFACSCPAGEVGSYYKHRLNLLDGDVSSLSSGNEQDVVTLNELFEGSEVQQLRSAVAALEKEAAKLKRQISSAKKAIGVAMRG